MDFLANIYIYVYFLVSPIISSISLSCCLFTELWNSTPCMIQVSLNAFPDGPSGTAALYLVLSLFPTWILHGLLLCLAELCCQQNCPCCLVTKSCSALRVPTDYSPPGSFVHGISQARLLGWVAIYFSK